MIKRGHQHLFTTLYQDSLIELEVTHIRALRPDVAQSAPAPLRHQGSEELTLTPPSLQRQTE